MSFFCFSMFFFFVPFLLVSASAFANLNNIPRFVTIFTDRYNFTLASSSVIFSPFTKPARAGQCSGQGELKPAPAGYSYNQSGRLSLIHSWTLTVSRFTMSHAQTWYSSNTAVTNSSADSFILSVVSV